MTRILQTDLARDALYTKVNQIADEKVSLDGNEIITGGKKFTANITQESASPRLLLNDTDIERGTAPSSQQVSAVNFCDKNGNYLGFINTAYNTDKSVITRLGARKSLNSTDTSTVWISVGYDSNGDPYTYAPSPSLASNATGYSDQIVTVGYLDGSSTTVVHKTGTETITGDKTLSGHLKLTERTDYPASGLLISNDYPNYAISIQNTSCTKGTAPSSRKYAAIDFYGTKMDGYADRLGFLECEYNTNKETRLRIGAYLSNNASDTTASTIEIIYPANGSPYTKAPATDVDNSILTTIDKTKATKGHFWLGNGMLVNWGKVAADDADVQTVSFDKAYSAVPCVFFAYNRTNDTNVSIAGNISDYTAQNLSSTGFKFRNRNIGSDAYTVWYAIGYRNA